MDRTGLSDPRRVARLLLLLLLTAMAGAARAQDPPQQPFLRVEAAAHTAPVARLATDAVGRVLASVSDDKTLRLWDLPEGTLRAVLRPPIAPEAEGELYAVALTPDGRRAFVAGYTGAAWDRSFAIYLFDTATGRMLARLPGLPAPVQHLAVSADGTRLAAALGGRAGIRVWNASNGTALWEDTGFTGPARMVAFEPQGARLAASGADGRLRIYDSNGRKLAERVPLANARPFGLAWSPDGGLLAVGFEDRLRVEVLAAADLRAVFSPDVTGLAGEGLPAVAWAMDGRGGVQLHAAGYARRAVSPATARGVVAPAGARGVVVPGGAAESARRDFVIRRWGDYGLGAFTDIPAARDAIAHLLPLPGGGLAFAAADPGWGMLAPDGHLAIAPRPPGADFRATGAAIAVSPDGTRLRLALRPGAAPLVFDALAGSLGPAETSGFVTARTESARLAVSDWQNANRPRLGRTPLALGAGEFARSLALREGDTGLLLGTDNHLRLFDAQGRPQASLQVPGAVWGLTLAGDIAVGALGDGTLRWWRIGAGEITELAALFIHAESRRWVLWTPEGLFDHAPNGGQELVGLHLNGGRAQTPEWASFRQAYRALYAPAAVRGRIAGDGAPARARLAQLGAIRERVGRLPQLAAQDACAVVGEDCMPVAWNARDLPAGATALRLRFGTTDRGLGLGPLDVLVNDRIAARAETRGAAQGGVLEAEVPLDPGANRIATRLYAEDRTLFTEGPALDLRRAGEAAPPAAGRLVVLAIGINRYANPALNLNFAVADADSVAQALRSRAGGLFRDVEVTVLRDAQATRRGILAALEAVARTTQPNDTFVLYLGGHGLRTEPDQRFLFLPQDTTDTSNWAALRRQGIEDSALVAAIARIRARDGLLLLDTCHAGQLTLDQLSALGNETGRFLLAASTSVQEALDSYNDRNGVFAHAVLEALGGSAATDAEGRVSALALGEWVTRRVPQLAAEKRHSQDAVFRSASRDLRSFPLALVPR
ncbi:MULTISPECIES: caspase family protein [Roseomonadaceae]|uniref:Caspase family protein n=1 Tax=Falsiroseomonas oleicola TaxID=2801474 RepID=A0ABS6H793_9PROT|nr:caspase family protein [Roseomonas oleicola]MBU8543838.1 caspase family protein [Roseomonas oleicola]